MRCYKIEDRVASQCDKPRDHKVCSECAAEGHTWRECTSSAKRCINCGGDHRTLAFKCPLRKAALTKAKEESKNKPTSYSQAASAPAPFISTPTQLISAATGEKIYTAMMIAMFKDVAEPGTFEDTLNRLLKKNNIAQLIVGEELDSRTILNIPAAPTPPLPTPSTQLHEDVTDPPPPQTSTHLQSSPLPKKLHPPLSKPNLAPPPPPKKDKPKNKANQPTHFLNPNLAKAASLALRESTLLKPDPQRQTRHSTKNKNSST